MTTETLQTTPKTLTSAITPRGVECLSLTKTFDRTAHPALNGIDLDVKPGTITVLLGPSGCGKTTLLRCISGLETPGGGHIRIGGHDVTTTPAEDRGIAMVFQNYALYPDKTVLGNLEFPLRMTRTPRPIRRAKALEIADLLQLGGLLHRKPGELSGGQRQRVGIGRALIRDPAVLLMDEPFSNLDAELRATMRSELLALQRRLHMTIVFVTHDQTEALALADQLVVMRHGRIDHAGAAADVFDWPGTSFVASFLSGMTILPISAPFTGVNQPHAVTFGVRPEEVRPGEGTGNDLQLTATLLMSELHGRDRLVHLDVDGHRLQMRIPARTILTDRMRIHIRLADIHYFDADGARVGA